MPTCSSAIQTRRPHAEAQQHQTRGHAGDQRNPAHRRAALDALLARPEFTGALAPGLDHRRAVDRAWLLTGLATFRGAVQGCDWTAQEYADWLSTTLQQQVLDRTWWRAET